MDSQEPGNKGWGHQQNLGYIEPKEVKVEGHSKFNSTQTYMIVSALDPNLVLDVSQNPTTKNQLIVWKKHGTNNQQFRISNHNGKYVLHNFSGGVVSVPYNSSKRGEKIQVNEPTHGANECWEIEPASKFSNGYEFKSFCGYYLDVEGQKKVAGTPVIQWSHTTCSNQVWYINPL